MEDSLGYLEPKELWKYFSALNAIPRASKKEAKVIEFMVNFGVSQGLHTKVDTAGNVIIKKPATSGLENRMPIILQSHLDMVHQKNSETVFDFDTEGIRMLIDGDWVRANGTTLGADNGIGVASIMAILASKEIPHPPLEALFTVDEETGMTGAKNLQKGILVGKILLNLDTEDDKELTIGCAGGIDIDITGTCEMEVAPVNIVFQSISISGLTGGHSGTDIHLGRANANKIMNRILWAASKKYGIMIHQLKGGGLRNAIPRESHSIIGLPASNLGRFQDMLNDFQEVIRLEYKHSDPNFNVLSEESENRKYVMDKRQQSKLLNAIYACPNGVYTMSQEIEGLVQTSNNLAKVEISNGYFSVNILVRSSLESEKTDLSRSIQCTFENVADHINFGGSYPGWKPKKESELVNLMSAIYHEMFGHNPEVNACHAGLECGIIGQNFQDIEMISFGPTIIGAHSPDEKVRISSVQKFWRFLLETLNEIPEAA